MFPLQEIDMARKIMYLAIFHGKVETNTTEKNYWDILLRIIQGIFEGLKWKNWLIRAQNQFHVT